VVVQVTTALIVSNFLLWMLVIVLLIVVIALARQIGVLHERVAPVGALMPMNGPKIGETLAPVTTGALDGGTLTIGGPGETRTFLYFLSPGCPICASLLPIVKSLAKEESGTRVLYASDGDSISTHVRYADDQGIARSGYVLSTELGMLLGVSKLPFAALIDEAGVLRARGLVNSREHIESLFEATELDVASLQEYLGTDRNRDASH